jgi:hypothetical protein
MKIENFENLEWHIRNNFIPPYSEQAIQGMLKTCEDFQNGKLKLTDEIASGSGVTVAELFEDLRLELVDGKIFPFNENFHLN